MNKMNLKNYWIRLLIVIIGMFFFNTAHADVKIKSNKQVSNFLETIKIFTSEKDQLKRIGKKIAYDINDEIKKIN